jgi:hypothetical protein
LLGGAAHAGFDGAVARLALETLAMTFLRRRMIGNVRHIAF